MYKWSDFFFSFSLHPFHINPSPPPPPELLFFCLSLPAPELSNLSIMYASFHFQKRAQFSPGWFWPHIYMYTYHFSPHVISTFVFVSNPRREKKAKKCIFKLAKLTLQLTCWGGLKKGIFSHGSFIIPPSLSLEYECPFVSPICQGQVRPSYTLLCAKMTKTGAQWLKTRDKQSFK